MVLALIGIALGVLIVIIIILIIKAIKTPSRDVVRADMHCRKCGSKINGLTCPKCKKTAKSFGV